MRDVLVTGGAGFIGSHACKALAASGYRPIALDNLKHGHADAVRWGPLIVGDIGEANVFAEVFDQYDIAAVIHFAAYAYVGESVTDPGLYYRNNVAGTLTLLEAMRDFGCNRLVFSSSCATYGVPPVIPITEASPQEPINPYGSSKLMGERMIADFRSAHGIRAIALRYFNAAGADPDGELGERHEPETHLIPLALDAAAGGRELSVFGDDYPTADGTCVRDYIHVSDLARAHVAALDLLEQKGEAPAALNLGTGIGISVRQIIAAVEQATGCKVPHRIAPRRPGDPPILVADPAEASVRLGWKPEWSRLEQMVQTAWAWRNQAA